MPERRRLFRGAANSSRERRDREERATPRPRARPVGSTACALLADFRTARSPTRHDFRGRKDARTLWLVDDVRLSEIEIFKNKCSR